MLDQSSKKAISDFLRKIADDIEFNDGLEFTFSARAASPTSISIGLGGTLTIDRPMKNDYEISVTVKDWENPP